MKLILEIDIYDLAHVILEDNPTAAWNISETHGALNAIRKSVASLSDEDKQELCKVLSSYYREYSSKWEPEELNIDRIGLLSES